MKTKYKIEIAWDSEDKIYVAYVPELDGCMSHGKTQDLALRNIAKAIEGWIKTAKEFKMIIPVQRYQVIPSLKDIPHFRKVTTMKERKAHNFWSDFA
jgi:predicted RNase H-like HicB family nuclease